MKKSVLLVALVLVVVVMAFGFASAGCSAGSVGAEVFAAAGGDPSGGQVADALGQVDDALAPVEAAAGQDIPIC